MTFETFSAGSRVAKGRCSFISLMPLQTEGNHAVLLSLHRRNRRHRIEMQATGRSKPIDKLFFAPLLGLVLVGSSVLPVAALEPSDGLSAGAEPAVVIAEEPTAPAGSVPPAERAQAPHLRGSVTSLEPFNRQILLKEIELERFAINFRKMNNVQGRWRGWRYFLSQEANAGATAGGLVYQAVERQRVINIANEMFLDKNGKVSYRTRAANRAKLGAGLVPQIVGQTIGAAGSGLELGINFYHEYQARKAGYGPKPSIARVLSIRKEIEGLFAQRQAAALAANLSDSDLEIAKAEEAVLKDITSMGLAEYVQFHVRAKRFRAFQDSLYVLDIAKNTVGAVGNVMNLKGLHERRPHYAGPGGILTLTSGILIIGTPILSRLYGKAVARMHEKSLTKVLEGIDKRDLHKLNDDRNKLLQLVAARTDKGAISPQSCSAQTLALLSTYEQQSNLKQCQLELASREIRDGTRAATENITVGTAVGGTKVTLGVCSMISGFRYAQQGHKGNSIFQAGTIAYASGSFLTVGDNIRLRIKDEWNRYRLGKKRQLPMQVLGDRLKALDAIESSLKTCSGKSEKKE